MGRATLILSLIVAALLLPARSTAQYQITPGVVACGGGTATGAGNQIDGTVGQSAIGVVSGTSNIHEIGFWYLTVPGASAAPDETIPPRFALGPGVPSPGRDRIVLSYAVPKRAAVAIRLYDVSGRVILTLVDGEVDPGNRTIALDGGGLPGGIYFCRMTAERFTATQRLVWVK